jgi:hypothetical protein
MKTTIFICESLSGDPGRAASILSSIIGNTRIYTPGDAPAAPKCTGIVLVFGSGRSDSSAAVLEYLAKIRPEIAEKPVAVIGVGPTRSEFSAIVEKVREITGKQEFETFFSEGPLCVSALADIAEKFALIYRLPEKAMPGSILKEKIEEFVKSHNTLTLAAAKGDWVRCTPLEYIYLDGMFYIISEGGLKCKGLWQNENVSAAIYKEYTSMGDLKGLQITGKAAFVEPFGEEYTRVFSIKNIAPEKLLQLAVTLYLIRICPTKYEMLDSDFKNEGFDVKQSIDQPAFCAGSFTPKT